MKTRLQICAFVSIAAYVVAVVSALSQTVTPVPSFSTLISSGAYSASSYLDVAGYYNSGDAGGGGAYQGTGTCAITATANTIGNASTTIAVNSTAGIITGMSIYAEVSSDNPIPPGDTIVAVSTVGNTITLAQPTINSAGLTTLVLGGNGGTIFMDYQPSTASPTCFYRQNYNGDVRQFGAKCDVIYSATDGSVLSGSLGQFTSSLVTFTQADVGKTLQLVYAQGEPPFRTTILSLLSGTTNKTVILANSAPASFPNDSTATDANMNFAPAGNDNPGAGLVPGQIQMAASCGSLCTPAKVQVTETGLVAFATPSTYGTGYQPNDILYGYGTGTGSNQVAPAQVQVLTVNGSGAVLTYGIVYMGLWKGSANPSTITWQGGHGSGFLTPLLPFNNSFGAAAVTLNSKGSYPTVPTNPVSMGMGVGGWSVDLTFSAADWSYGTEDTAALQNIENYAETYPTLPLQNTVQYPDLIGLPSMRGLAGNVYVPAGMCYASGVLVSRPVSWSGAGPSNSRLVQLLGSSGISVNGSPAGFFTMPIAYPPGDDYQQAGYGGPLPRFENLAFWGSSPETQVDVAGTTPQTSSSSGIVLVNPVSDQGKTVALVLSNVDIEGFPNADLSAQHWGGDLRGYQVTMLHAGGTQTGTVSGGWPAGQTDLNVGSTTGLFAGMSVYPGASTVAGIPDGETIYQVLSGAVIQLTIPTTQLQTGPASLNFVSGNCLDMEGIANPAHFYGLVTASCDKGINIVRGAQYEFHGWVGFSNNVNVSVTSVSPTGHLKPGDTITFYGAQFTESHYESLYLDQQDETVVCYMCKFLDSDRTGMTGDFDTDILLGSDAGSGALGSLFPVLQLSAPIFGPVGADSNILFGATSSGTICTCRVTLDGLSVYHGSQGEGLPVITNAPQPPAAPQVLAGDIYAPLQFATGTGTSVAASPPTSANFGNTTFGQPSRLFSYLVASGNKNFTAGGNWNISFAYDVWDIERSGTFSAGFTDTWDTATHIIAAINNSMTPPYAAVGQRYSVIVCNNATSTNPTTPAVETLQAPDTSVTLQGLTSLSPGQCGRFALLITAISTPAVTIVGG